MMSSLARRMQRKVLRRRTDYEPAPQVYQMLPNGGYRTLHPTKGWRVVSPLRIRVFGRS